MPCVAVTAMTPCGHTLLMPSQDNVVEFVGNRTECALLVLLRKLGHDYVQLREQREADQVKVGT